RYAGVDRADIGMEGADKIVLKLPGYTDRAAATDLIEGPGKLEFRYVRELESTWRSEAEHDSRGRETGFERILGSDGKPLSPQELDDKVFSQPPILEGSEMLPNSRPELTAKGYIVHFEFS